MVNTNCSDLSTPFKIKYIILIFLLFSSFLFAEDISVITQEKYPFKVNSVNMLSVKIVNNTAKDMFIFADLKTNEFFTLISKSEKVLLKKNEPLILYFSYFLNAQQASQMLSIPLLIRNEKNEEIKRKYCFIHVEPYLSFNRNVIKEPDFLTQKSSEDSLTFLIVNQSNVPIEGEVSDDQSRFLYRYSLEPGITETIRLKFETDHVNSSLISRNYFFKNYYFSTDSVSVRQDSIRVSVPYYYLWEGDPNRFHRVPAFISNKVTYQEINQQHYWDHTLKMYAYGSLSNQQYLSFYLKKDNGRYLNRWNDHDEYYFDVYSPYYQVSAGKSNYKKSELISPIYGEGLYLNYLFHKVKFSLMNVNEKIKDAYQYRLYSLAYCFKTDADSKEVDVNQYVSLNVLSKRKDQKISEWYINPEASSKENDKINIQLSFNLNSHINLYNEVMWVKQTEVGDIEIARPSIYNQLSLNYQNTQISLRNFYQNEIIYGEYDYKKFFEATLNQNFKDYLMIYSGYRYQNLKSDYFWSYSYQQQLQSAYAKTFVKIYSSLYNVSELNYLRYKNESAKTESSDDNYASGIAVKSQSLYAECLYGKRDYSYFEDQLQEDYFKFNIRVNVSNQLIFNTDNKVSLIDEHYSVNHYLSFDTMLSEKLRATFSADYSYFEQKKWQNLMIYNSEISANIYQSHQLRLSTRFYQYINYHKLDSYSLSLEYVLPLSVPVLPKRNYSEMKINLIDPYTSKPVKNALISANQYYALTNDEGIAFFRGIPRSKYDINIINPIPSFITEPTIPISVDSSKKTKVSQQIKIIESSSIKVNLKLKETEINQNNIYLNQLNKEQRSSINTGLFDQISLLLENEDEQLIQTFNKEGTLIFSPLRPGKWRLTIYKNGVQDKIKIHLDEVEVFLTDNQKRSIDLIAETIIHQFESFEKGGVITPE